MDDQITHSQFVSVWCGGISWGSGVGAAFGAILGILMASILGFDEAVGGDEFLLALVEMALLGILVGSGIGFSVGCLAGLITGFVLHALLATRARPEMTVGVTVGVMTVLIAVAAASIGPYLLVVPMLALYPLWRVVSRAV